MIIRSQDCFNFTWPNFPTIWWVLGLLGWAAVPFVWGEFLPVCFKAVPGPSNCPRKWNAGGRLVWLGFLMFCHLSIRSDCQHYYDRIYGNWRMNRNMRNVCACACVVWLCILPSGQAFAAPVSARRMYVEHMSSYVIWCLWNIVPELHFVSAMFR